MDLDHNSAQLLKVLEGLSLADDAQRSQHETTLSKLRGEAGFVKHLMILTNNSNLPEDKRMIAVCCLNDNIRSFYKETKGEIVPEEDKQFLRDNIIDSIEVSMDCGRIRNTYIEILDKVVKEDFPKRWTNIVDQLISKLKGAQKAHDLLTALLVVKAVVKCYQREIDSERLPLEALLRQIFPFLENLSTKQLMNPGADSIRLFEVIVSIFKIASHMELPQCLTQESLRCWMILIKALLDRPLPDALVTPTDSTKEIEKREASSEWRIKISCFRIIGRFAYHCSAADQSDLHRAISEEFVSRYALSFMETCFMTLASAQKVFVAPSALCQCMRTVAQLLEIDTLYQASIHHLETLMLDYVLPLLALTRIDAQKLTENPIEYIYSQKIKSDDHNMLKNKAETTLYLLAENEGPDKELLIYKLVNFIGYSLMNGKNPRTNKEVDQIQIEYLLHAVDAVSELIQLQKPMHGALETFLEKAILPLLDHSEILIKARACQAYAAIGGLFECRNKSNYERLCRAVCSCMTDQSLVLQVAASEALIVLLQSPDAKRMLFSDLETILNILLGIMNKIELDDLVEALESIVEVFSSDIQPHAYKLVDALARSFQIYKQNENNQEEVIDENLGGESTRAAEATLDAIGKIIQQKLDERTFKELSPIILSLLNETIMATDFICLEKCLGMLNQILYRSSKLDEIQIFYFPVLCYLIIGKPNKQYKSDITVFPEELQAILSKLSHKSEWALDLSSLIGCFLNYMQKLGRSFLSNSDFFGTPFIDLIFQVVKKIGEECMQTGVYSNLLYSMRLLIGLLENFRGDIDSHIPDMLSIVKELIRLSNSLPEESIRHNDLKSMVLQLMSILFWYSPEKLMGFCREQKCLELLMKEFFTYIKNFESENERERELYLITSLLSLDSKSFPDFLSCEALLKEVLETGPKYLTMKKTQDKNSVDLPDVDFSTIPNTQSQQNNSQREAFAVEDEDDFEEESSDEFIDLNSLMYDSPFDKTCPLLTLKSVLEDKERNDNKTFQMYIGSLSSSEQDKLLALFRDATSVQNLKSNN